jgi:antimicrobial peptide system SdpA family protein
MSLNKKIVLTAWVTVSLLVFFSSFKEQVFVSVHLQRHIGTIFPEGWGFFTKNPRDPLLDVYKVEDSTLVNVTIRNQSFKNKLGFSRKSRILGYESSVLANEINAKSWSKDKMKNLHDLKEDTVYNIRNKNNRHLNKGKYLLMSYKMIPFAWSKSKQELNNPISYVYISVNE